MIAGQHTEYGVQIDGLVYPKDDEEHAKQWIRDVWPDGVIVKRTVTVTPWAPAHQEAKRRSGEDAS